MKVDDELSVQLKRIEQKKKTIKIFKEKKEIIKNKNLLILKKEEMIDKYKLIT